MALVYRHTTKLEFEVSLAEATMPSGVRTSLDQLWVVESFVNAVGAGDFKASWELMSKEARLRYGCVSI